MKVGFHLSIKSGIDKLPEEANKQGLSSFQFFTRSSRQWKFKEITKETASKFKSSCSNYGFTDFAVHLPYLPNFSTSDKIIRKKSMESLNAECERCDLLDVPYLVIHIGSHKGEGIYSGIKNVASNVNQAINKSKNVIILLETSSGTKNSVGSTFEELASIISLIKNKARVGVCFDTCHVFASGYDLRNANAVNETLDQFDKIVGIDYIKFIHLNDSKGDVNSKKDRHAHLTKGFIGETGFKSFVNDSRISSIPMVMETPDGEEYGNKDNILIFNDLIVNG